MAGLIRLFSLRTIWNPDGDLPVTEPENGPHLKGERRVSARRGSGAAKFLRAFRSGKDVQGGTLSLDPTIEVNPDPKGPSHGDSNMSLNPSHTPPLNCRSPRPEKTRLPERSLSFQNGGRRPLPSKSTPPSQNPFNPKAKQVRPKSFLVNSVHNGTLSNPGNKEMSGNTQRTHLYENVEVIRGNLNGTNSQFTSIKNPPEVLYANVNGNNYANVTSTIQRDMKKIGSEEKARNDDGSRSFPKKTSIQPKTSNGTSPHLGSRSEKKSLKRSASEMPSKISDRAGMNPEPRLRGSSRNVCPSTTQGLWNWSGQKPELKIQLGNAPRLTASATLPRPPSLKTPPRNGLLQPAIRSRPSISLRSNATPPQTLPTTRSTPNLLEQALAKQNQDSSPSGFNHSPQSSRPMLGKSSDWSLEDRPPPERDPASLKHLRYGPGHEKFPSWPIPAPDAAQVHPVSESKEYILIGNSSRTKSWSEETHYPKEKDTPYARPYMKRPNNVEYSHHVNVLVQNSERILPATFENSNSGVLQPPLGYRDGLRSEYVGSPSALEGEKRRGTPPQKDTHEDLDLYGKKYDEQTSTYAHSEGYHSFISSDSASVASTTFIDQLKRDCSKGTRWFSVAKEVEKDCVRETHSPSGRESVATVVIHSPNFGLGETWATAETSEEETWAEELRQTSRSSSQLNYPCPVKNIQQGVGCPPLPERKEVSQNLKKFPLSTYTRPSTLGVSEECKGSCVSVASPGIIPTSPTQISPLIDTRPPPSVSERINKLEQQNSEARIQVGLPSRTVIKNGISKVGGSDPNLTNRPEPQQATGAFIQGPDCELIWNGANTEDTKAHFAYLDPEKRHRVAGNTLKAIQKQALLAYYERHAGKASEQTVPMSRPPRPPSRNSHVSEMQSGPATDIRPNPPERPPKKPHLRNQHVGDSEPVPPPPPRASMRQPSRAPPPLPSKPSQTVSVPRLPSPELPPPPPPLGEDEIPGDAPFPPPPTPTEVGFFIHSPKISPNVPPEQEPSSKESSSDKISRSASLNTTSSSTGFRGSTLSPTGWEEYHNIRPPSTTLIFTSQELSSAIPSVPSRLASFTRHHHPSSPAFLRSTSVDSCNMAGFSQFSSRGPPPVAQVAPLQGPKHGHRISYDSDSQVKSCLKSSQNRIAQQQTAKIFPLRSTEADAVCEETETRHCTSEASSQTERREGLERVTGIDLPLPADSAYFTTSESKAKFLRQYVNDMEGEEVPKNEDLKKQKDELVLRLSRKLEILRKEQDDVADEMRSNEALGEIVIEKVKLAAKRNEFDKLKLHVEEIEKITSLLLSLSGRLARAESALLGLSQSPFNPHEKKTLERKRDRLREQLEEAEMLKESIDKRATQVAGFLKTYLSPEDFADYQHFTKMKAKLIIDAREIDDKIKLGDEQMMALEESSKES